MRKIFVAILLISQLASYADEKKALKHLEKGEYDKVIETLDKEISKDTVFIKQNYIPSAITWKIPTSVAVVDNDGKQNSIIR